MILDSSAGFALGDGARNTVPEIAADVAEGFEALGHLVGDRSGKDREIPLFMQAQGFVLDGDAAIAAQGQLVGLVAHQEQGGEANGIGAQAVPEAGVGKSDLELGRDRRGRVDFPLGEAELGAKRGVAPVGDGLLVSRVLDRVSLGV